MAEMNLSDDSFQSEIDNWKESAADAEMALQLNIRKTKIPAKRWELFDSLHSGLQAVSF